MRSDEAAEAQERGLLAVWPGDPLHMTLSLVRRESRQGEPVLQAVRDVILAVWG